MYYVWNSTKSLTSILSLQQRDLEASLVVPALNCVTPLQPRGQLAPEQDPVPRDEDVETELYIGLPGVRCSSRRSGQAK